MYRIFKANIILIAPNDKSNFNLKSSNNYTCQVNQLILLANLSNTAKLLGYTLLSDPI